MELPEILQLMQEPEKLIDPNQMVLLNQHISGFITDYTLQLDEAKLAWSFEWEGVKYINGKEGKPLSDKQTDISMMHNPATKRLNEIKRTLGELKRYRSDINRRLDVIMGIKRHGI